PLRSCTTAPPTCSSRDLGIRVSFPQATARLGHTLRVRPVAFPAGCETGPSCAAYRISLASHPSKNEIYAMVLTDATHLNAIARSTTGATSWTLRFRRLAHKQPERDPDGCRSRRSFPDHGDRIRRTEYLRTEYPRRFRHADQAGRRRAAIAIAQ